MCGIVSLFSNQPISQDRVIKAADALHHRGPDSKGFWFSDNQKVALAHRRLSIIDLDTGGQPISNENNTIHIVVNGELYDFQKIRKNLEQRGHTFKTQSDSEIALHLYEEYGLDFVTHLRGEFSFTLYDETQNRLVAVRDRFGIKPLCFAYDEEQQELYIASEAKAIFAAGHRAQWDKYAFFHACNVQYIPTNRTLFKGVHQLDAGHILIYDGKAINIKKYWDMDYPTEPVENLKSEAEYIDAFSDIFEQSVRLRLQSDVPICCHLSGGLDSASVAAIASKHNGSPLDCFTVSFEHEEYDELPIAKEMAEKIGSKLHVVSVSQDDLVNAIPDAVYHSEGLSINGHLAGKYLLNKHIRTAGFKVALTGEGADEVLAGYPHLREDIIAYGGNDTLKQQLETLYKSNEKLAGVFLAHGDTLDTTQIENALGFLPSFLKAKASLGLRVTSLLSDDFQLENDIFEDLGKSFDVQGQLKGRHIVNQSSYLWTKLTLTGYILRTLGDGCEMAQSIEGRVPFLDHHLFNFSRQLPMHMKIKDLTEKYILREAVKGEITETVYKRQKHPFIAPPVSRFSNEALNVFIQDMLRSKEFASMPFWDSSKILKWLDKLPNREAKDQIAAEPVLMMVLTSFLIHKAFNMN